MTAMNAPVVLVTGSSRGIGKGIARSLAKEGCSVAITYVGNQTAAEETARICREESSNPNAKYEIFRADISSKDDRELLVDSVIKQFGTIDALVNNAGIAPRKRLDILDSTEESFEELLRTNLQGPYFLTQYVARWWLTEKPEPRLDSGFKVIFVTSVSSETVSVGRGEYCVSKAGLSMGASLWAARLAAEGIQVYEIRPGIVATDMTEGVKGKYDDLIANGLVPQKRWGDPMDTGKAAASLIRGDFPFSTGTVIYTDGGFHIPRL